jgi:LysR family transcriptional regulator, hydrogen peroxide-inducible genes activator
MELHQLRYFSAVATLRNFSRAAEKCHVAQPSLSQQIMKLERELGERLFDRTKRSVNLTPAGERFFARVQRVLEELEHARDDVGEAQGPVRGRISLGALPTVAPYFLPGALQAFSRQHPAVEILIHEDTTANLVRAVEQRELDVALVSTPAGGGRVTIEPIFSEELWLAVPRKHPLAKKPRVAVADLASQPFILMQEGHCLAGQALQFCSARGVAPQTNFRSAQIETIQAFVAAGHGVSLVPAMARKQNAKVVYRSIRPNPPQRTLVLAWSAQRTPTAAMRALTEFFRAYCLESRSKYS